LRGGVLQHQQHLGAGRTPREPRTPRPRFR
jgi:hypothetical protein